MLIKSYDTAMMLFRYLLQNIHIDGGKKDEKGLLVTSAKPQQRYKVRNAFAIARIFNFGRKTFFAQEGKSKVFRSVKHWK